MADSQRSDVFVLESESQLFNSIISQELNEHDSDDEQSSLQSQQMMQDVNSIDVLEVIVNEVQAHPILWSRQNPDYKRSDKKQIVWSAIAQKVGLEVEKVKLKWKNLSDGFKKCLDRKRDLEKSGSGYSKQPTYLSFLQPVAVSTRFYQQCSVLPEPSTHVESNPGNKASQQNQQQAVPPTAQPPAKQKFQFPQATVIPKKKKKVVLDPVEEYLIKSIEKNEEENKLVPAKKEDADEQFCQSITHTLRRLGEQSVKKNQLAKIKIQQLLFDIEFDD
ncbi:Transcription factor Adf-1 [Paramuricea clavata]|uniref:Transcription factor Adf-1 n=1 Tax=Paramuricea clavata TaxID=317549 RepID=A0A7D9I5W4_PARCT|nr:Transcription factor Adf-1 [Paramuricea clavata]